MRDAFIEELELLASADPRICFVTGDLGFGVVGRLAQRLPRQFLNVGVAEQNMAGIATGLALSGKVVFTYSIGNFPTLRCLEQLRNDACYHSADVKVVAVGGGFSYGALGMSHHATEDIAIMRAIPEMRVIAPGDDWEARCATRAMYSTPGPFYLRLDKTSAGNTQREGEMFRLGKARRLKEGAALTLISTGGILSDVLEASIQLAARGVACRVVSMHTLSPIDSGEVIEACIETGGIITVEEHVLAGGLGGAVAEICMDLGLRPKRFERLAISGGFCSTVGSQGFLRRVNHLDASGIISAALALLRDEPQGACPG